MPHRIALTALLASLLFTATASAELPLVFEEDFEQPAEQTLKRWKPTDANAWKLVDSKTGKAYSLFQQSKYKTLVRSPFNISLADGVEVTDFRLETDVLSTKPDYPHRSMTIIFGYQDPSHFYYVHFGKKTDNHANQIFIVDGKDRAKISTKTTDGTNWDDNWHHVKIERNTSTGDIKIFFDDMQEPVMTAVDKTFTWGKIGLGSFDDTGDYDNVKLWGVKK